MMHNAEQAQFDNRAGAALGAEKRAEPRPPKTWDECGIEEKVARLHGILQDTRSWLRGLADQQRYVPQHEHGQRGEILVPQSHGIGMVAAGSNRQPYDPLA